MSGIFAHARPAHQTVAKSICYALTLEHADGWHALPVILRARLNERERGALACVALRAMDGSNAAFVADLFTDSAGMPAMPMVSKMEEASFWADMATTLELEAYCFATFRRMAPDRQAAFLNFIQRGAAA
ncbi:hypothetical protein SAMN05428995_101923 [Loktanella sp. DSM 29012]|nr:hypothetical protein SAMN05428995_101923 [Loktanella sp. DSM 29012]